MSWVGGVQGRRSSQHSAAEATRRVRVAVRYGADGLPLIMVDHRGFRRHLATVAAVWDRPPGPCGRAVASVLAPLYPSSSGCIVTTPTCSNARGWGRTVL